jgi:hypothetical protein
MRGNFAVAMSWCQVSLLQLRIKLHVPNSAVCRGTSGDVVQNIERAEGLTFTIRPSTRHVSAFVRMYGPIYDTVLFQHVEGTFAGRRGCGLRCTGTMDRDIIQSVFTLSSKSLAQNLPYTVMTFLGLLTF